MRKFTSLVTTTAVLTGAWLGCSSKNSTELVPGVSSQIQVPRNLKSVRIDWAPAGGTALCSFENVNPITGGVDLPRTLGILNGQEATRAITITIWGYDVSDTEAASLQDCYVSPLNDKTKPRILRRARLSYVNGKILFLPMPLRYSCLDKVDCKEDQTCKAGECVSADIDSSTLPEYNDSLIKGEDNLCFSPKMCASSLIPTKTVNATDCTYTYAVEPPAGLTGMNVKLFYDGGEAEILDLDKEEGFELVDAKTIKLAPGLCKIAKGQVVGKTITDIMLSPACAPKTIYQPLCKSELTKLSNLPDGGFTPDGVCNVSKELQPAPSLLYVVMDDAQSMKPVYGPEGLKQVLDFNLADPAFRTTYVAFRRLDHNATSCTGDPNPMATPEVAFKLAPENQAAVAAVVGDITKVNAANPAFYVDAALRGNGVYKAIKDFNASTAFNRRAVMFIVNRRIGPAVQSTAATEGGTCNLGALNSVDLAATARSTDKIYTYAVMLGNTSGTPVIDEASALATAGGTSVLDARSGGASAATVFNKVVADLGSCLYETPTGLVPSSGTKISYLNPLTVAETSIPFASTCSEATQTTANGWNADGNRIRVCGQACTTLRDVISTISGLAQAEKKTPPKLPLYATKPCE